MPCRWFFLTSQLAAFTFKNAGLCRLQAKKKRGDSKAHAIWGDQPRGRTKANRKGDGHLTDTSWNPNCGVQLTSLHPRLEKQ